MELYDQIRKISFMFFIALGLIHFLSGLFYANGYLLPSSGVVNRVSFIPFVLITLTYALSNVKYNLLQYGKNSKALDYTFLTLGILISLILIAVEFVAQDSPTPLIPPSL